MHLSDYFIELVAYVNYFLRSEESQKLAGDQLKNNIQKLLSKSEDGLRKGEISTDDYDQARFAVCAAAPLTLLITLFVTYCFILKNVGENYLQMVMK